METYTVTLNGKQYGMLEKMLSRDNAQRMAMNQAIDGQKLFAEMLDSIYSPVEDGWSTPENVLAESETELALLRHITAAVVPEDENYFVNQLGKKPKCKEKCKILIELKMG